MEKKSEKQRSEYPYTFCYCEENIWKLEQIRLGEDPTRKETDHIVFISNESKKVPVWTAKGEYVVWDYHVILVEKRNQDATVYDFDAATLPFPCPFQNYAAVCFRPQVALKDEFKRMFRVLKGEEFLRTFSSDRSHMIDPKTKTWMATPPAWPCIQLPGIKSNLFEEFIDMKRTTHGKVLKESAFLSFFGYRAGKAET